MTMNVWRSLLVLCIATSCCAFFTTTTVAVAAAEKRPSWQWCVVNIGTFYVFDKRSGDFRWTRDGERQCGFRAVTVATLQREAFFPQAGFAVPRSGAGYTRHTFVGDSTALRAYAAAVNTFMPPHNVQVGKVRQSPPSLVTEQQQRVASQVRAVEEESLQQQQQPQQHQQQDADEQSSSAPHRAMPSVSTLMVAQLRFSRLVHVSMWPQSMNWTFAEPLGRGLVSMSLGNWDLNWRLQPDYAIPKFGRRRNFPAAQVYWSKYAQELFDFLGDKLATTSRNNALPIVIVKEQLLPHCNASRFAPKRSGRGRMFYRHCDDQVRPIIVPMYRRVVAALAWARNIPVVPVDFLMSSGSPACRLGDGIHLDAGCLEHEQQLIWNVYLLLRSRNVRQGFSSSTQQQEQQQHQSSYSSSSFSSSSSSLLSAIDAVNETLFDGWWCSRNWDPCRGKRVPEKPWLISLPRTTTSATIGDGSSSSSSGEEPQQQQTSQVDDEALTTTTTGGPTSPTTSDSSSNRSPQVFVPKTGAFQPAPSVMDIIAMSLIVLVPVVAYLLLRSVSST